MGIFYKNIINIAVMMIQDSLFLTKKDFYILEQIKQKIIQLGEKMMIVYKVRQKYLQAQKKITMLETFQKPKPHPKLFKKKTYVLAEIPHKSDILWFFNPSGVFSRGEKSMIKIILKKELYQISKMLENLRKKRKCLNLKFANELNYN